MNVGVLTRSGAAGGARGDRVRVDPRFDDHRRQVDQQRHRRRKRRLVALVAVTLAVLAAYLVVRSPLLDIDHVRVTGAVRTRPDLVRAASGLDRGDAMTAVDVGRAERRIERLPWVADATVTRDWPGTVRIEVIERVPVAVAGEGAGAVLVDRDGRVLGPVDAVDGLPTVGPVPAGGEPGDRLGPAQRARVALVAAMPPDLIAEVASVGQGRAGVQARLHDGITVIFGDAAQLRAKFEVAAALLEQGDRATIETINVSVPSAPALTTQTTEGA